MVVDCYASPWVAGELLLPIGTHLDPAEQLGDSVEGAFIVKLRLVGCG